MVLKKNAEEKQKIDQFARFIYGPVLSRRLGFSLGIDILPPKTCNLNCIYCQLGPTHKRIEFRHPYFRTEDIIQAIRKALERAPKIDYLTFSGSGEPTLNAHLGELIKKIKKITPKPVAVLTNSLLLTQKEVRQEISLADLLVPSLDAADQSIFLQINRPSPAVNIDLVIEGLINLREEYRGQIWLEIMLVKDVNNQPEHLLKLKEAIVRIRPNKVQLNTVVRPPAESWVEPLEMEELMAAAKILGPPTEIVTETRKKVGFGLSENLEAAILSILKRRPASLEEIAAILGEKAAAVSEAIQKLLAQEKIQARRHYHHLLYVYSRKGKKDERTG